MSTHLEAKVAAYNKAAAAVLATWAPVYRRIVPFVGKKIEKADGSLTKAFKEAIEAEIPPPTPDVRYVVYSSGWHVYVEFTAHAPFGDVAVFDKVSLHVGTVRKGVLTVLAGEPSNVRCDYDAADIEAKIEVARQAQQAANDAKNDCYPFTEFAI